MERLGTTMSLLALLASCGLACAQDTDGAVLLEETEPADRSGWLALGDALFDTVPVQDFTGDTGNLGIEYAIGYYWVTHNGDFSTGTQVLIQFDEDFNEVETYFQLTNSPNWGHRDGTSIESENLLFFGAEDGEVTQYVFDPSTQRLDLASSEILQFETTDTVRALAWDPTREFFYSKDFSQLSNVFVRDGLLINFFGADASTYGAAYDPVNDTVWLPAYIDVGAGTTIPNTRLVERDPDTGFETGREFEAVGAALPDTTYHIPGGADIRTDGDCTFFVLMNQGGFVDAGGTTVSQDFVNFWELTGTCASDCVADLDGDGSLTIFDFLAFQSLFDAGDLGADFDGDGSLTIFDFLAFQNAFDAGDLAADFDGDGELTIFDFLEFQNEFDAGCP